jgi:hypothetical protein
MRADALQFTHTVATFRRYQSSPPSSNLGGRRINSTTNETASIHMR